MSHDLFISYRSTDLPLAEALLERLLKVGFAVWFDRARLETGLDWHREIEAAADASRVVLAVMTPAWRASEWCRFETYGAEHVVPVLFSGRWEDVAPPPLRSRQYFDASAAEPADWNRLFETIRGFVTQPRPEKTARFAVVRYAHNPYFVGRESLLLQIHEQLHAPPTTALTTGARHAVTGMGGVGKTTLAREYAEKFWRLYRDVLWITAEPSRLPVEFARLAVSLRLVETPSPDPRDDARRTLHELNGTTPRLLILDNAADEESIQPWLPTSGACQTIITSRFKNWSPTVQRSPIGVLAEDDARDLLLRRTAVPDSDASRRSAKALATELGLLPLALEQAAAFISKTSLSFEEYLALYVDHRRQLLAARSPGATEYPDSVATTWLTTERRLRPPARTLLALIAHFAPDDIPVSVLQAARPGLFGPRWPRDALAFRTVLAELASYSMITLRDDSVTVHRLVQTVQIDRQHPRRRRRWARQMVLAVGRSFPPARFEFLAPADRLAPQAVAAAAAVGHWKFRFHAAGLLLNQAAIYFERRGRFAEAEQFFNAAIEIWRKSWLGRLNPFYSTGLNNLGLLYSDAGRYDEARTTLLLAMRIRRAIGLSRDSTAAGILSGLGNVSRVTGDLQPGERYYREALAIRERTVGPTHELYAEALGNLAVALSDAGRTDDADRLFRQALDILRAALGERHPSYTQLLQNTGVQYYRQGRYAEAELLYRQALAAREAALGPDHPDLAYILTNLGKLYRDEARYAEAVTVLQRSIALREAAFGDTHPELARSYSYLGTVRDRMREFDAAEPLHRRAGQIAERTAGDHNALRSAVLENHRASLEARRHGIDVP